MMQFAENLARARDRASAAQLSITSLVAEATAIQERIDAAKEKYATAFKGLRDGSLDEAIAAARMAASQADTDDLQTLLSAISGPIAAAQDALAVEQVSLQRAANVFKVAENAQSVASVNEAIRELELKLCAALKERFRLACERDGVKAKSLFGIYVPLEALHRAVAEHVVPN